PLVNSVYDYKVRDVFVEAVLTETYRVETTVESECAHIFEVPPEASVNSFKDQVGSVVIEGVVEEKLEADRIQAWKLDKVNDEMFQIRVGLIQPNSTITISVGYVYTISSDIIEDSVRLTIPTAWGNRSGASPVVEKTMPKAPTGTQGVTITVSITVSIEVPNTDQIFSLNSPSHNTAITTGFSDKSYKTLTPVKKQTHNFVLVWTVPQVDQRRCIVEKLGPPIATGQPQIYAMALTLVSNVSLNPEEHEYIFLIDHSYTMEGARIATANLVAAKMLDLLLSYNKSTFNIYNITFDVWCRVPGGKFLPYNAQNVTMVKATPDVFYEGTGGGLDIDNSLKT
ncbi:hypothetical protein B0H66DRAFT_459437, partial [Apodospora peruviana]